MPQYTSGAEVIADARIRLDVDTDDAAVLVLEGRDDFLVFAERAVSLQRLVIAGNKQKALDAHRRIRPEEQDRLLVLVDCDYDVAAGRLRPQPNLIITKNIDMEADFAELGVVRRIALRFVPAARESDQRLAEISAYILGQAVALAQEVGKCRRLSAVTNLGLSFRDLELRRFRDRRLREVDAERLAIAICQRSKGIRIKPADLLEQMMEASGGLAVCCGKDLAQALSAVIHQDFGVNLNELRTLQDAFTTVDSEVFGAWSVVQRVRGWEASNKRLILAGP